ncbi:MAG: NAD-dependent epimerase/dehydratase family protein [Pseudomonadota bacterium]
MAQFPKKGCALITGAGGRLGKLLRAARDLKPYLHHEMVFQSRVGGADIQWSPGDSFDTLPRADAVIALWGRTSGSEEDLADNARLARLSSEMAVGTGATRIMHISTAAVYGPGRMMNEDHPTNTCNLYGKSKKDMETQIAALRDDMGLTHICLRLANVVGADSLAPALRSPGAATIDMFNADTDAPEGPRRSYIGAGDLLGVFDGLLSLPAETWPDVLNVACPKPISMDALIRAANKDVIWRPAPASAAAEVTLDASRLLTLLPSLTFRTTASALIEEWQCLESHRESLA